MSNEQTAKIVGDIPAKLAQDALHRIEAGDAQVYEGWCTYGAQLLVMRGQLKSDKDFGAWVTDNGLDTGRAAASDVRSNAMWVAEHKAEVDGARVSGGLDASTNHPNHIRQAARTAGFAWAAPKLKTDGTAKAAKPKATVGWREVVQQLSPGPLPPGFRPGNCGASKSQRAAVEAAYGAPIPERLDPATPEAAKLATAVRSVIDAMPAAAPDALEVLQAKYDALLAEHEALKVAHSMCWRNEFDLGIMRQYQANEHARRAEWKVETQKAVEKKERELTGNGYALPKKWTRDQRFRQVIQLCHPDKHGGSATAVEVTQWLLQMRG